MHVTSIYFERTIDASHIIPNHPGKCSRLHGHTYRFEVWVSGPINQETGMIIDFFDLKECIDAWDHRHLNDVVECIPTAENLVNLMHTNIVDRLDSKESYEVCVRLWETPTSWAQTGSIGLLSREFGNR